MPPPAPRVVCISQARMDSQRLPGKVLHPVAGMPLIGHHLQRLARCRRIDRLVLATTVLPADDPLETYVGGLGVPVFRGAAEDVLDRVNRCAAEHRAEVVVRVTADCPLIDPELVDEVVGAFCAADCYDYYALDLGFYPRGLDVEVMRMVALAQSCAEAAEPAFREHVTPFLYRNPDRFRIGYHAATVPQGGGRWCVDEAADLDLIGRMLAELLPWRGPGFGWRDCLAVLDRHPEWIAINQNVAQKTALAPAAPVGRRL